MVKVSDLILIIFIVMSGLYTYIFFHYLFKEYQKATLAYYTKKIRQRDYCSVKKETAKRRKIKNNVTKLLNPSLINSKVGYAVLEFLDENGNIRKSEKIYKNNFSIGREDSNDIVLQDDKISRKQCTISQLENKYFIYNLSKTNQTKLNGLDVNKSSEISFGDIVDIGDTKFRFADIINSDSVVEA